MDPQLYQKQLELEKQATEMGRQKYLRTTCSKTSGNPKELKDQPVGHCLIRALCGPVGKALEDLLLKDSRCHPKVRKVRQELAGLGLKPLEMAYLGVRGLLAVQFGDLKVDKGSYGTVASIAVKIGRSLFQEVAFREFETAHGGFVAKVVRDYQLTGKGPQLATALTKGKQWLMGATETDEKLSNLDAYACGAEILKVILAVCPDYFTLSSREKHSRNRVQPTPRLLEWLQDRGELAALLSPVHRPMVVPPLDWTSDKDGGYLTHPVKLVRRTNPTVKHQTSISEEARGALNMAQRTPWRINRRTFEVADHLFNQRSGLAGLTAPVEIPADLPPGASKEDLKARKKEQLAAYQENIRSTSAMCADQIKLDIARDYLEFDKIYFPHTFDWRSRIYPVPTTLNPQGDDLAKGLLEFSEAHPLGDSGERWLAIHGANVYGKDKLPYTERHQWIKDHHREILWSAKDPYDHRWWMGADEPFKFLSFCFEWSDLHDWKSMGQPSRTFKSRTPVALDGTCSGLQHFSALLRDDRGASSVNLIPKAKPSDIYSEVAEEIQQIVDGYPDDTWQKRVWDGYINRTTAKRGTMTQPYGVTKRGLADQLDDLIKTKKEYEEVLHRITFERARARDKMTDEQWAEAKDKPSIITACLWMSDRLDEAINKVVVASQVGRDFIQDISRAYSEESKDMVWVTPNGTEIAQGYRSLPSTRIETYFGGTRIRLNVADDTGEVPLNKRKSSGGSSPNFIHSLDATHLLWTVYDCYKMGVKSFSLVHDSFGVHPGNVDTLNVVLRNTFVRLYSRPILEDLLARAYSELGPEAKLPEIPKVGQLDLEVVRLSPYIFM